MGLSDGQVTYANTLSKTARSILNRRMWKSVDKRVKKRLSHRQNRRKNQTPQQKRNPEDPRKAGGGENTRIG